METITKTEKGIAITETKQVVVEEYTAEELKNELATVESELENWDVICKNRHDFLEARLVKLKELETELKK